MRITSWMQYDFQVRVFEWECVWLRLVVRMLAAVLPCSISGLPCSIIWVNDSLSPFSPLRHIHESGVKVYLLLVVLGSFIKRKSPHYYFSNNQVMLMSALPSPPLLQCSLFIHRVSHLPCHS